MKSSGFLRRLAPSDTSRSLHYDRNSRGYGPHSTAPFLDVVVNECQRQRGAKDDIDFSKMMIHSAPIPFYTDRPIDHQTTEKAIGEGLSELERTDELIEPDLQSQIDELLLSVRLTKDDSFLSHKWNELIALAEAAGAEALMVACLNLSAIRQHMKTDMPVVDASHVLAYAIVSQWLEGRSQL